MLFFFEASFYICLTLWKLSPFFFPNSIFFLWTNITSDYDSIFSFSFVFPCEYFLRSIDSFFKDPPLTMRELRLLFSMICSFLLPNPKVLILSLIYLSLCNDGLLNKMVVLDLSKVSLLLPFIAFFEFSFFEKTETVLLLVGLWFFKHFLLFFRCLIKKSSL